MVVTEGFLRDKPNKDNTREKTCSLCSVAAETNAVVMGR